MLSRLQNFRKILIHTNLLLILIFALQRRIDLGMGAVAIFSMTIVSGIIAPTGDVWSDVKLLYDAVTFNLGTSYELAGCRACYGLHDDDVYMPKKDDCQVCVSHPKVVIRNVEKIGN